jgi:hypothetical protein
LFIEGLNNNLRVTFCSDFSEKTAKERRGIEGRSVDKGWGGMNVVGGGRAKTASSGLHVKSFGE